MFTLCYSNLMKKILLILLISFFSDGEIEDKTLLKSFFEGCVDEVVPEFDQMLGFQFEYCGCATHAVANQFTFLELGLLGLEIMNVPESEQDQVVAANGKLVDIATACILKAME